MTGLMLICLALSVTLPPGEKSERRYLEESYATARKEENGLTYIYTNDHGKETLKVIGSISTEFDEEQVMDSFRESLGLKIRDASNTCYGSGEQEESTKSLLESFSEFFVSTRFGANVQQYYDRYAKKDVQSQVVNAQNELFSIETDISKLHTQEMILKQRQAELSVFLQEELIKDKEDRNPTVVDLVTMEDDRLAILESRLYRLKRKLLTQKREVANYIETVDRISKRETFEQVDGDMRIYARNMVDQNCPGRKDDNNPTIIQAPPEDEDDHDVFF